MTTESRSQMGWRFWLKWVSANALAVTISVSIFYVGGQILAGGAFGGGGLLLILLGIPVVVGKVQSLILDKYVDWYGWTGATIGGWVFGCIIVLFLLVTQRISESGILPDAILGSILGITVGVAQWGILEKNVQKRAWWIVANVVAISSSLIVSNLIVSMFYEPPTNWAPLQDFVTSLLSGGVLVSIIVASLIFSVITGSVLAWLLGHRR